ncbi:unnamed protein product [Euphydryas editha]|uniref:Reverse transcriptase Ty1/copia-type domain-containing protein n=1 Tax=Euphydryas editha TaxID=104508 RepID=A0AAU9UCQ3_EUPED|nr:unnamed protein product [Euphydryas editha]
MTAIYLKNRSPTTALAGRIPEEVWTGSHVDLSHLQVTKGYRLSVPSSPNTVILSRSVAFIENKFYYNNMPYNCNNLNNNNHYFILNDNSSNNNIMSIDNCNTTVECSDKGEIDKVSINVSDGVESDDNQTLSESEPVSGGESDDSGRDERLTPSSYAPHGGEAVPGSEAAMGLSGRYVRERRPPQRYGDYNYSMLTQHASFEESKSYEDAIVSPYRDDWMTAMQIEHDSLVSNEVWRLVNRPTNKNVIECKWVYKVNHDANGKFVKFKARLVAKGFTQKQGIDYNEIFSPVVRHSSIRILFYLANEYDLYIDHIDVNTAFLNSDLNETIYMEQPEGFSDSKSKDKVCLLQKSIYGLKQASKMWNEKVK